MHSSKFARHFRRVPKLVSSLIVAVCDKMFSIVIRLVSSRNFSVNIVRKFVRNFPTDLVHTSKRLTRPIFLYRFPTPPLLRLGQQSLCPSCMRKPLEIPFGRSLPPIAKLYILPSRPPPCPPSSPSCRSVVMESVMERSRVSSFYMKNNIPWL